MHPVLQIYSAGFSSFEAGLPASAALTSEDSVTDLPKTYKTPGRVNGYTHESAWWAFNRLGTLTAQRWGDARYDVEAVWNPIQKELFDNQKTFEEKAMKLYNDKKPQKTIEFLTKYSNEQGNRVVNKAWELGDQFWTKYDEKF